jgi:ATP-dependent exoDNAse (exonuclease V) alpha subunit
MWADVQKILHRYVDDLPLFQRLETHLQNSKKLILLRPEEKEAGKVGETEKASKAIYTTRSMLQTEKSLIENAESLSCSKSHGVEERAVVQGLIKLEGYGGLSQDQIKAIYHLTDCGQLKCVIGIAGAGKTTALKVCQDIWKESGYTVYGLAPTGKAAQNLEREGIKSSTLHKFLKDFDEGRCQYNQNSVLVLDEAGMVDVERFSGLMEAVKQLGVKLIVVGGGAQLQPVEAGPAFRLVTERIGKSELHTAIRQKEEWQKEATLLLGRQETKEAIQIYRDRGHVHIVEESLSSLSDLLRDNDKEGIVKLYEVSKRTSSLMYREISEETKGSFSQLRKHQDFESYLYWKNQEKEAASHILKHGNEYKPLLEERSLDPLKMALLFVDKKQDKEIQQKEAQNFLQNTGLEALIGIQRRAGQSIDVRNQAKETLVQSWLNHFKENSEKSSLMLAFSNRDMSDLNRLARIHLKESGYVENKDFTYTVKREDEDDFGRKYTTKTNKDFSIGDRIVFTRNNRGLGVQNGSMGIITSLDK